MHSEISNVLLSSMHFIVIETLPIFKCGLELIFDTVSVHDMGIISFQINVSVLIITKCHFFYNLKYHYINSWYSAFFIQLVGNLYFQLRVLAAISLNTDLLLTENFLVESYAH